MSDTEDNSLSSIIVTKYQTAADIANKAMHHVVQLIKAGAKVGELCAAGDAFIIDAVKGIYAKGDVKKGIAFPTCISCKSAICHLAPLVSDPESLWEIEDGEAVRVELGVHVDGYISQVATTVWVGVSEVSKTFLKEKSY